MHLIDNNRMAQQGFSFKDLVEKVLKTTMNPEDIYEVAAVLESMGWNDSMVNELFGAGDIFDLAQDVWEIIQSQLLVKPVAHTEKVSPWEYFVRVLRSFLRGLLFAFPMAISVMSMLTLRFSLWSYKYFSLEQATAISIGTILSFVVVGGFTQAIGRRGFLYIGEGYINMARKIVFFFVRMGFAACFIVGMVFFLFNSMFSIYPWHMVLIILLYYFVLSGIWLSVTIMYILKRELTFTGLITAGIALIFVLFRLFKINIIYSQLISITLIAISSTGIVWYFFLKAEQKMERGISPTLPRLSIMLYTTLPYFTYGFLYFTFLNVDRLLAWSANFVYMPYYVWFRGDYELGLDFALLVLILPMGLIEVFVNDFMANLLADQKNYAAVDAGIMNKKYVAFYRKRMMFLVIFSVLNGIAIYFLVQLVASYSRLDVEVFGNPVTLFVFVVGLIAYSCLAVGLMNSLILFCLSQPVMVLQAIFKGLVASILIGFLLSRWVYYSWAVIGLLAGAILFMIVSSRQVMRVFNKLDFYLYAAM